jgi:hypothetical protein
MARRTPTDDTGPAVSGPICGYRDTHHGADTICVRNPGHGGKHTPVPADREVVRKLADRSPEGGFFDVPESPTDVLAMQTPTTTEPAEYARGGVIHGPADGDSIPLALQHEQLVPHPNDAETLPAPAPPGGVQAADPSAPPDAPTASEPTSETTASPAGSGGGSGRSQMAGQSVDRAPTPTRPERSTGMETEAAAGRPSTGRSIGRVVANTAMDTALGVPPELLDERAHGREATEILLEAAADHWRHDRLMPAERLLDLEAIVGHMVGSRGLR